MAPSPYIFIISIGPVDMNKYARFDEIPSRTLKDIKETKRHGRTDGRTDNVKTVYLNAEVGGLSIRLKIKKEKKYQNKNNRRKQKTTTTKKILLPSWDSNHDRLRGKRRS